MKINNMHQVKELEILVDTLDDSLGRVNDWMQHGDINDEYVQNQLKYIEDQLERKLNAIKSLAQ